MPEQEKPKTTILMLFKEEDAKALIQKCEYVVTDPEKASVDDFISWLYEKGYKIIIQMEVDTP